MNASLRLFVLRFILPCIFLASCLAVADVQFEDNGKSQPKVTVTVTPGQIYLRPGQSVTFHAVVTGAKSQKVRWSASEGTITADGQYTANGTGAAIISAQSVHCARATGTATTYILSAPTEYTVARSDQNIEQLPLTMPSWGGLNGIGTKWCNPAFSNLCMIRATDGQTVNQSTVQTSDSGELALWAVDSRHLIVKGVGARKFVIGFDPATEAVTRTPLSFGYDGLVFSHTEPQTIYALDGTRVRMILASTDWSSVTSDTVMFDFASCLPAGFDVTWSGTFGTSLEDNSFRVAYSNTGAQGSAIYQVAYQMEANGSNPAGCYVLNTANGSVNGPNGLIGTVDDGVNPLPDRFTMHAGGGGQNPQYTLLSYSQHQPDGTSGCFAGNCEADSPYVWEVGTTHLRVCSALCDGHSARGYLNWATGKRYRLHGYANPAGPMTPLVDFPDGFPDQHGSWANTTEDDAPPAFLVSTSTNPVIPFPTWGYDEVLAVASDGTQRVWRFGQTLNSGLSQYFIVQNAIGVISADGRWLAFTSDMCGAGCPSPAPLGYEADGKTPRGDVFIMEAK